MRRYVASVLNLKLYVIESSPGQFCFEPKLNNWDQYFDTAVIHYGWWGNQYSPIIELLNEKKGLHVKVQANLVDRIKNGK